MTSYQGYTATVEQVDELMSILSIMRPHESRMEAKFIQHYLAPLKPQIDGGGNLIVKVGKAPILWSCHIDTVHRAGGIAPIKLYDGGMIRSHPRSLANCLGADDGAGVWLMLQMIRAGKPGLYVFHRGEECGCIGSRWIAKNTPKLLEGIEAAIAFDRKDTCSIITHQMGGRCCSEDFSKSLGDAIGIKTLKSDTTGSVTDTAQYTDLVGECTNLSVGYKSQHFKTEEQDLNFLLLLHDCMMDFDYTRLVYKRKPGEKEKRANYYGGRGWFGGRDNYSDYGHGGNRGATGHWNDPRLKWENGKEWSAAEKGYIFKDRVWDNKTQKWVKPIEKKAEKGIRSYMDTNDRWLISRVNTENKVVPDTHLSLVRDYPEQIAKILEDKQYGLKYLHEEIAKHGGKCVTAYLPVAKEDEKKGATVIIAGDSEKVKETASGIVCRECMRLARYCACDTGMGAVN